MNAPAYDALVAELCRVGLDAVRSGLALASGGNLSARLPGSDEFVVTGRGTFLDALQPSHFALLGVEGKPRQHPVFTAEASSEWKLHQRTYLARPDVNAVVHLHPEHTVLLDALGHPIRLLTLDHVAYVGRTGRVDFFPNGSDELADGAAEAARDCDCVVLAHHGCSTVSTTVVDAYRKALNLESAARATYRMLLLGDGRTAFPEEWVGRALHG